ncbi:MAG: hypothetical protein HY744_28100 [Deltaproteobacteria bacterium]|nr:hypothetical protein [Deltaproteobacteria bacterium]
MKCQAVQGASGRCCILAARRPPMATSELDLSRAVVFDLESGLVRLRGAPLQVLLPAQALAELCRSAGPEARRGLGRAMGGPVGRRVAARLAGESQDAHAAVGEATQHEVVAGLAAELAICGLGVLGAEQWGRALVLVHDRSPLGAAGDELLGEMLRAALEEMAGTALGVVLLERDGARARFLVASTEAAPAVRERLGAGESWGAVLAELHRRPAHSEAQA